MKTDPTSPTDCVRTTLPALMTIVIAIASTAVLALAGCASSAGIATSAQLISPSTLGLKAEAKRAPTP